VIRICGLLLLRFLFEASNPLALSAQDSGSRVSCGTDSAFAEVYRSYLQTTDSAQRASAKFQWVRPTPALCASAERAMIPDSATNKTDEILYLYKVTGSDVIQHAVVGYSEAAKKTSEWPAIACFFDKQWKMRGACVAM